MPFIRDRDQRFILLFIYTTDGIHFIIMYLSIFEKHTTKFNLLNVRSVKVCIWGLEKVLNVNDLV